MSRESRRLFRNKVAKRCAKLQTKKGGTTANGLTKQIMLELNVRGWKTWRNNVMGVFDQEIAAKRLLAILKTNKNPTKSQIKKELRRSYRKSHELEGVPDVIGHNKKNGKFIGVEVKVGNDKLSPKQEYFLKELNEANGIGFVAKDPGQFHEQLEKFQI